MTWARFMTLSLLEGRCPERGRSLQLDPADGIAVGGENAVQLRVRKGGPRIDELDGSGGSFLVPAAHQLERPSRRHETRVGGGDRRPGHGRVSVGGADLDLDPFREVLTKGPASVDVFACRRTP